MQCREAEKQIQLYIDNLLSAEQTLALREHLAACPPCAALYVQLYQLDILLKQHLATINPPADFVAEVMAALPPSNITSLNERRRKRKRKLRIAPVATAAAILLAAGLYLSSDNLFGTITNNALITANNEEPVPYVQENQVPEPHPIFAAADPLPPKPPIPPAAEPEQTAPPISPNDTTYSGDIRLPAVAYSTQSSGNYNLTLLASYEGYDAVRPHGGSASTVNYYVKVDDQIQHWLLNLSGSESPVFLETVEKLPPVATLAGFTNQSEQYGYNHYSAESPDGLRIAVNQSGEQSGVYLYPQGIETDAVLISSLGGGRLISWADNNKFMFTDESGLLHVYYIAEQQELLVYPNAVGSACWTEDNRTIVFSGYDSATGHYNIYKVTLP
ncbi:MAG: anti-sigma factor [Clostridiales bacterium]